MNAAVLADCGAWSAFTDLQKRRLAEYATAVRKLRPVRMQWLTEDEWSELSVLALDHCLKSSVPIPKTPPGWVVRQLLKTEKRFDPLHWWWTQRLQDAYRAWCRNRIRAKPIDDVMVAMAGIAEPALEIEAAETALLVDRLSSKRSAQLRPQLERDVSRPFTPTRRAMTTEPDNTPPAPIDRQMVLVNRPPLVDLKTEQWKDRYFDGFRPPER